MPAIIAGTPLHSFVDSVRKALADVLSQSLGSLWSVEINQEDVPENTDTATMCFGISASAGLQGQAVLLVKLQDAGRLARKFLGQDETSTEITGEHKEAVEELLRQVAGVAATNLASEFGEVRLNVVSVENSNWPGVSVALLSSSGSAEPFSVELKFNPELLASISSSPSAVHPTSPEPPPIPTPMSAEEPVVTENQLPASQAMNLDLLLGVNLNLTLRFGQQILTLRQVLNLNAGSVVELDRQVQEPADLLLGDRVVARGEVVVVDGNYGLRIGEIIDPKQRIERI